MIKISRFYVKETLQLHLNKQYEKIRVRDGRIKDQEKERKEGKRKEGGEIGKEYRGSRRKEEAKERKVI